jgi:hypothetical protein
VNRRLGLLAALAFVLDVTGATWGLPARWHPDEKADTAARMAREGSLAPDSFINPTLPVYVMVPVVWAQQRAADAGLLAGRAADPALAGRILSAAAGALAVFLAGLLGARLSRGIGLLGAALLALAPGVVNLCHFATPEAWLILGAAATLLLAARHVEGRSTAWALGLVLGLAASTKYTAAALAVPVVIAVCLRRREPLAQDAPAMGVAGALALAAGCVLLAGPGVDLAASLHLEDARLLRPERAAAFVERLARALFILGGAAILLGALAAARVRAAQRLARVEIPIVAAAAIAGFLLGTPFAALEPRAFLSDLAFNDQTRFEYKGLTGASSSFVPYLHLAEEGLTLPVLAMAAAGLVVAGARSVQGDRQCPVLVAGALAPYFLVASSGHQALRFLAPVFPAAAVLAALGVLSMPSLPVRRAVAGLLVARAAVASMLVVRLFFVDSRAQASRWLEAHTAPGETVDLIANNPGYAPPIPPGRALRIVPTLSREMAPAGRFAEAAAAYPSEASPWLVLTASYYERFLEHPGQHPERTRFFQDLLAGRGGFDVAARFRQTGWRRPAVEFVDPEIVILRRRQGTQVPMT